jgi:CheY-like chemotaxis protein
VLYVTLLLPPDQSRNTDLLGPEPWRPRTDADLLAAQLRGIDEWHRLFGNPQVLVPGQSREARLDDARHADMADLERAALEAWAEAAMRNERQLGRGATPRAVVAHRNDWLRDKVCAGLQDGGIDVVLSTGDGAEASAAIVLEQPDLVFVEDLLPVLSGVELIRRTRLLAPDAMIGAHARSQSGMPRLQDAGARATFSRRIPPAEVAAELVACLYGRHSVLTLV